MQINERIENDHIVLEFIFYNNIAETRTISIKNRTEDDIFNSKCEIIDDLDQNSFRFKNKKKQLIKSFAANDKRFNELYASLYPHGGYHGGGRPKGSKTERTERFQQAITLKEKIYLEKCLAKYREKNT